MKIKVLYQQGNIKPGVWDLSDRFANKLLNEGKAEEVKEGKKTLETKEEKFHSGELQTKSPLSKINFSILSNKDLKYIADNDTRKTAREMAQKELNKR